MTEIKSTRNQQRAQQAFGKISEVKKAKDKDEKWAEHYGRQCMRLPALIQQCGLCQAVAFFESKSSAKDQEKKRPPQKAFETVLNDLSDIMDYGSSGEELAKKIRAASVTEYQLMTREAMSCSEWLQRYAEAVLKVKRTDQAESE